MDTTWCHVLVPAMPFLVGFIVVARLLRHVIYAVCSVWICYGCVLKMKGNMCMIVVSDSPGSK